MQRPDPLPTRAREGFVLPTVLGIILLAALFAAHVATETGTATLLATQRLLHQRAFEAAESGLLAIVEQLHAGLDPAASQQLQSADFPTDSATVDSTITSRQLLPNGYSAGRVQETLHEIRSAGHSARGTDVVVVQGVRQLRAVAEP
jgi:Tfp pilus assembly protein PilX